MDSPYSLGIRNVAYRPVSHCQKQKCLWCGNDATQEGIQKQGNLTAVSRCCDDPNCMRLSAEMCNRTAGTA